MGIIIAITGGSGVIYGVKLIESLNLLKMETHLVISEWGEKTIKIETNLDIDYIKKLARKQRMIADRDTRSEVGVRVRLSRSLPLPSQELSTLIRVPAPPTNGKHHRRKPSPEL